MEITLIKESVRIKGPRRMVKSLKAMMPENELIGGRQLGRGSDY
jgi:hypothetical protein